MTLRIQQLFSLIMLTSILFLFTNSHASSLTETPLRFKNLVILGDSLSDNGNLYNGNTAWWLPIPAHFIPKSPYYEGRFSNGPVWSDLFSDQFAKQGVTIFNYAVGGSLINKHLGWYLPYTIGDSMNHYFLVEKPEQNDIVNSAFVLWIGANDYLQGVQYFSDPEADTDYAVDTLRGNIEQLIHAHADKFIIMNIPDVSKAPYNNDSSKKEALHELTVLHNRKLETLVKEFREEYPAIDIQFLDTQSMLEQLFTDPAAFNQKYHTNLAITEKHKPCWTGGYRINHEHAEQIEAQIQKDLEASMQAESTAALNALYIDTKAVAQRIYSSPSLFEAYSVSYKNGSVCKNPEQYIFWDKIHPTTTIHQAIAEILIKDVTKHWGADKSR